MCECSLHGSVASSKPLALEPNSSLVPKLRTSLWQRNTGRGSSQAFTQGLSRDHGGVPIDRDIPHQEAHALHMLSLQ